MAKEIKYDAVQKRFAERMKIIRERMGMSVVDFCEHCGISPGSYSYYVYQGGMPTLYTATVIAEACGVTMDEFMGVRKVR